MDLLLHPLKSELNFPIGPKEPLDFSPERWTAAIHALDAVFFVERQAMAVPFQQSGRAHATLRELTEVIEAGYAAKALQRSPHLVLLNAEWYTKQMRPVMAKWMLLWLEANHVGAELSPEMIAAYLTADGATLEHTQWEEWVHAAAAQRAADGLVGPGCDGNGGGGGAAAPLALLHAWMAERLDKKTFQLLNLASEWVRVYLPHCLQK